MKVLEEAKKRIFKSKKKLGTERGSVTLFVLIAMLFFLMVGIIIFISNMNSSTTQQRDVKKIQNEYNNVGDLDKIYNEQVEKQGGTLVIAVIDKFKEIYQSTELNTDAIWINGHETQENSGRLPLTVDIRWPDGIKNSAKKIVITKIKENTTQAEPKTHIEIKENNIYIGTQRLIGFSMDNPFTITDDCDLEITAIANEGTSTEISKTVKVRIDRTKPVITVQSGANATVDWVDLDKNPDAAGSLNFGTATAEDATSGVKNIKYAIINADNEYNASNYDTIPDGLWQDIKENITTTVAFNNRDQEDFYIYYRAEDVAGNVNYEKSQKYTVKFANYRIETEDRSDQYALSLSEAMGKAVDGSKIVVIRDVNDQSGTDNDGYVPISKTVTIDTNGHNVTMNDTMKVASEKTLTLVESKATKGQITSGTKTLIYNNGKTVVNGAKLSSTNTVIDSGETEVLDGEITSSNIAIVLTNNNSTLKTTGGTITGSTNAIKVAGANSTITIGDQAQAKITNASQLTPVITGTNSYGIEITDSTSRLNFYEGKIIGKVTEENKIKGVDVSYKVAGGDSKVEYRVNGDVKYGAHTDKNGQIYTTTLAIPTQEIEPEQNKYYLNTTTNNTAEITVTGTDLGSTSYTTSNENIATITENPSNNKQATITGVSEGKATITITDNNSGLTRQIEVIVDATAPEIAVVPETTSPTKQASVTITVTEAPQGEENGGSGLASENTYQYYVSTSATEAKDGEWTNYTSGQSYTIGTNVTGRRYVFVKEISDNAQNTSTQGGTKQGTNHVFGPYIFDNSKPEVTFGTNGNTTYAKSQSTTVTVADVGEAGLDTTTLKYQWTQSTTAPAENTFSTSFTSGQTLTKDGVTGDNWYLWILAKDNLGNTEITKSGAFYIDNTPPTYNDAQTTIENVTTTGYDVVIKGVEDPNAGMGEVKVKAWTTANGQDDAQETNAVQQTGEPTTWKIHVNVTDHKNEYGEYNTSIRIIDSLGNEVTKTFSKTDVPGVVITYNPNGGTTPNPSQITKGYGAKLGTLPATTRTGYDFDGWFTAQTGGDEISENTTTPAANTTYYAHWTAKKYTVTANANDGTIPETTNWTGTGDTATKTVTFDSPYGNLPSPTRTGYTFKGWYKETAYTNVVIDSTKVTTASNHTIYAKWEANEYTVHFNGDGSTAGTVADQSFKYDEEQALNENKFERKYTVNYNGEQGTPAKANDTATYTFANWINKATNLTYTDKQSVKNLTAEPNGEVTLYAVWTPHGVTLPTATREGYIFNGWYDAAEGGNKIGDAGDKYIPEADTTLHAQWRQVHYTILVGEENLVAETLEEAIKLAEDRITGSVTTATITATMNYTDASTANITKNITINIPSGLTITMDKTITVASGTTTFTGAGTIQRTTGDLVTNNSNVVINGGTLQSNAYVINNNGNKNVTINNGTLTSSANIAVYNNSTGTIEVSGGTISGTNGIYNNANGTINISGGDITGTSGQGIRGCTGTVTVTGGTINGKTYGIAVITENEQSGIILITGGKVISDQRALYAQGNATITLGIKDESVPSKTSPEIISNTTETYNAIQLEENTIFNFYDGKVTGRAGGSINREPTAKPDGYQVVKTTTEGRETAVLEKEMVVTADANGGTIVTPAPEGWTPKEENTKATKTVVQNTLYGTMPEPTNPGYSFQGWHGKNQFDESKYLRTTDYVQSPTNSDYAIAEIQLKPNTTYKVSIIRYNGFDGKGNGYLLLSDSNYINSHWTAIAHSESPNASLVDFVYQTNENGLLYIGRLVGVNQTRLDTIWENTDVQIEEVESSESPATAYEPYYITSGTTVVRDSAHTLTAVWEGNKYTVHFNKNDNNEQPAVGEVADQAFVYGQAQNLNANEFVRIGYIFKGWNTKADGTGTPYADKASVSNLIATVNGEVTLYAQWEQANATFVTGPNFNAIIKKLAGDLEAASDTDDTSITRIKYATIGSGADQITIEKLKEIREQAVASNATITAQTKYVKVSDDTQSNTPIYVWFENGTLYWFSEDDTPYMNADAGNMFRQLTKLQTIPELNKIDTSKTTTMHAIFYQDSSLTELDVSKFNTSKVTLMQSMFNNCSKLTTLDVSKFDTSKVTNMYGMFQDCSALTSLDVSKLDTSKVTNMQSMFYNCSNLTTLDVSKFDTSNVTSMATMFYVCTNLTELDVSKFDTSKVTSMSNMFQSCSKLTEIDVSNFDTSKVTTMRAMFLNCNGLTELDLRSFDTSKVTSMWYMFRACNNLTTIYASDKFVTTALTNEQIENNPEGNTTSTNLFDGDTKLVGGSGTAYDANHVNADYAHIDEGTQNPGYFTNHYIVNFNANGGTGLMPPQSVAYNRNITLNTNTFTKTGYTFAGWATSANGDVVITAAENKINSEAANIKPSIVNNAITLYAKWTPISVTVTLDNQNATTLGTTSVTATYDSVMPNITAPTRTGYTFKGYYSSTTAMDLVTSVGNLTTTSKRITFANYVNSANSWAMTSADAGTHIQGKIIVTDSSLTTAPTLDCNDISITARSATKSGSDWIIYVDLDLTEEMVSKRGTTPYDTTYRFIDVNNINSSSTVTVEYLTRGGKKYYDNNGTGVYLSDFLVNSTIYAKWEANTYTVSFNANGGTGGQSANVTATYDSAMPEISTTVPTKKGHTFMGWYDNADYTKGTQYYTAAGASARTYDKDSTATLYAGWQINKYTLTLNPNGGTFNGTTTSTTVEQNYNTTYNIANNPTREGYIFGGWQLVDENGTRKNIEPDGNIQYFDGSNNSSQILKQYKIDSSTSQTPNIYNNKNNGTVTHNIITDSSSSTGYSLEIKTDGEASPNAGGLINVNNSVAGTFYYHKIIAKVPTGYRLTIHSNATGIGASSYWLTDNAGTNQWKTYIYAQYTGYNEPFMSFGHIALDGTDNTNVTWWLQESTIYRIANNLTELQATNVNYTFTDSNQTLKAVWNNNGAYLTFDKQGGTFGNGTVGTNWTATGKEFIYNIQYANAHEVPYYTSDSDFAIYKPGYTLDGWYTEPNGGGTKLFDSNGQLIPSVAGYSDANRTWLYYTNSFTLYANWVPNTYKVQFHANSEEATGTMADQNFTYGTAQNLTANAYTWEGHNFTGWNTAANGSGTGYTNSQSVNNLTRENNGTVDLYAQWEAINYSISYELNGGTVSPANPSSYTVETNTFTLTTPTKTGYTFKGWLGTDLTGDSNTTVTIAKGSTGNRSYTANWVAIEYSITYTGGGTASPANPSSYTIETPTFTLTNPTREGYTFKGWSGTGITGDTNQTVTITKGSTGNRSYTANWTAHTYKVHFDKNAASATGTMADQNFTYDVAQNLTANAFTNSGLHFLNWNTVAAPTESNPGVSYENEESIINLTAENNGVVTLYAQWGTNPYKVRFNKNEPQATGEMTDQNFNVGTAQNLKLNAFTFTGHHFKEWRTNSNGTGDRYTDGENVNNLTTEENGIVDLYAIWETNTYKVHFEPNGGSGTMSDQDFVYGTAQNLTANAFTYTGRNFTGWNTAANGSGTGYTNSQSVNNLTEENEGTFTLYAQWSIIPYSITYELNGGSLGEGVTNPSEYNVTSDSITLNNPTKTGYTFKGWSGTGLTGDSNKTVTITQGSTGNRSYTANWTPITYTITYRLNGGTASPENPSGYTIETNTFNLTNPTRPGYTFSGWSGTNLTGDSNQTVTITQGSTGNKEFEAHWNLETYTITYELNGGSLAEGVTNPSEYNVTSAAITLNNPSKENCIFAGWTGSNGETPQVYLTIPTGSTGNRTYNANWTDAYYRLVKSNGDIFGFMTLKEAVDNAEASGSTIYVLGADVADGSISAITIDKNITINTNGNTVTMSQAITVANGKTVTFTGNGTIKNTSGDLITNNGTIAVDGATLDGAANAIAGGTVTVSSGTVKGGTNAISGANVTVTGGTVKGGTNAIYSTGANTITIGSQSGTVSGTTPVIEGTTGYGIQLTNAGSSLNFYSGKIAGASTATTRGVTTAFTVAGTVTYHSGYGAHTETVSGLKVTTLVVPTLTASPSKIYLGIGQNTTGQVSVTGSDYGSLTYTSSNPTVASVSNTGAVEAKTAGTVTITITDTNSGLTTTVTVVVDTIKPQWNITVKSIT